MLGRLNTKNIFTNLPAREGRKVLKIEEGILACDSLNHLQLRHSAGLPMMVTSFRLYTLGSGSFGFLQYSSV
jgi:hypothetical protein